MLINHTDQLQLELAKTADILNILELPRKYQVETIADADRADGFATMIINDFHFNNNAYYELACLTTRKPAQGQQDD